MKLDQISSRAVHIVPTPARKKQSFQPAVWRRRLGVSIVSTTQPQPAVGNPEVALRVWRTTFCGMSRACERSLKASRVLATKHQDMQRNGPISFLTELCDYFGHAFWDLHHPALHVCPTGKMSLPTEGLGHRFLFARASFTSPNPELIGVFCCPKATS